MAQQIRIVLTVDAAVKKLIESSARKYCDGNISAYVRGLVVFHQLLLKKDTGHADIPGWMLGMYPLPLIDRLTLNVAEYRRSEETAAEMDKVFDDTYKALERVTAAKKTPKR
jgi:hypothetical protein